jgi:DNA-binding HxlR family transcriptional regulator
MRRTRFDDWDCSIARSVDILGDWWTPMVIRAAFLGARRFEQFSDALGIPRNVLTERLNRLVGEGIMVKVEYQDRPVRHEYRLTDKGVGLYPVMVSLLEWGNRWLDWDDEGPPVDLVDRATGEVVEPVLVDGRTGQPLDPRGTRAVYRRGDGTKQRRPAPATQHPES